MGDVLAVGEGAFSKEGFFKKLEIAVGDKILFSSYAGTEVKTEDTEHEYLVMSQDDVLAIVEG